MIILKEFQKDLVDKLISFTSPRYKVNELVVKSPTGSGKTITLLSWINDYLMNTHDNVAFVWFTPGAGELEEQSQDKAKMFNTIKAQSVDDALLQGFGRETVTFINYERVINKKSKAMLKASEQDNLQDKIREAKQNDRQFILIIDEAHRNDTQKAHNIISLFNATKTVRVSATIDDPKEPETTEFYEVSEERVIESGLITKSVVVNEGLKEVERNNQDISTEFELLLLNAENKRKEIVAAYKENNIQGINPLVLVQIPDQTENEPDFVHRIEEFLQNKMRKTYNNQKLGIWLSERKQNYLNVKALNNETEYLIIKQAIATGWDAPRAKILVKLRENMGETFTIQTIGRIRRMPQPMYGHYNVDVLDNSYLYTFDNEFLSGAFSQGGAVKTTPLLYLKDKAKQVELISEHLSEYSTQQDERKVRDNLFEGLRKTWKTTNNPEENKLILKNKGFKFGNKILNTYKQGRFDVLSNSEKLQDLERKIEANYRSNHLDLLHAFHELDRVTHLTTSQVEALLKRLFLDDGHNSKEKILKLDSSEWTAFIINNWRELREIFRNIDLSLAVPLSLVNITENSFIIPRTERYTYNPRTKQSIVESNAYEKYTTSIIDTRPSWVEKQFEMYLEKRNDVDFVYKNGDKGQQYFSLVYGTNNGGRSHFYPDFIPAL